jgi:pantetheine-phosphate adenylyltransferase
MKRIAVFPGSFDPVTRGHESVIRRARPLFDEIIVAIGENSEKKGYFPLEQRLSWLENTFRDDPGILVRIYSGLTVDFCREAGAQFILRGLRTSADFEFERTIGQVNRQLDPAIETVFVLCNPEYASLSSSIVREVHKYGGDISQFLPENLKV